MEGLVAVVPQATVAACLLAAVATCDPSVRCGQDIGKRAGAAYRNRTDDLRITRVSQCVARGFKSRSASYSQVDAGGDRWLLMAVRGHFGGMATRARTTGRPSRGAAPGRLRSWIGQSG